MKSKKNKLKKTNCALQASLLILVGFQLPYLNISAQTTLSGDHIVTGDLQVGATGTTGNLLVIGDTGSPLAPGLKVTGDGGVLFVGSGTGSIPAEGAGSRLMWYPGKNAFRVGGVTGGLWNDGYVGSYSFATGKDTRASGMYSVAFGNTNIAAGGGSFAMGYNSNAQVSYAVAIGEGCIAGGQWSLALGVNCQVQGAGAVGLGANTQASANSTFAMGQNTRANSYATIALGVLNVGGYTDNHDGNSGNDGNKVWISGDPLLEIGSGTSTSARKNALTLFKNGSLRIEKKFEAKEGVRVPPQGDLSMGEFTSGNNPAELNPATGLKYPTE